MSPFLVSTSQQIAMITSLRTSMLEIIHALVHDGHTHAAEKGSLPKGFPVPTSFLPLCCAVVICSEQGERIQQHVQAQTSNP